MNRARVFRFLRIGWSVVCGILCLLLIVLWVRSYWRMDVVHFPTSRETLGNSAYGIIQVSVFPKGVPIGWKAGWGWESMPLNKARKRPSWRWSSGNHFAVHFPIWAAVLATLVIAAVPWVHRAKRFSLRTLLIAMTVVAVAIGLIVVLSR
jgi:hypothetical protein